MVTGIIEMAGGLKAAGEIVKSLIDLKTTHEVQAKAIELQAIILSVQSDAMEAQAREAELLQKMRELEEELRLFHNWSDEKESYELRPLEKGGFVYALKSGVKANEPPHWLCTKCFQNQTKSILQFSGREAIERGGRASHESYECPNCSTRVLVLRGNGPETNISLS